MALPTLTTDVLVVFGLVGVAILFFVTDYVRPDVTALSVIVALVVLEPWTGVGAEQAFMGFANTATVTVAAMYMLSEGVHRTGVVRRLGAFITRIAQDSPSRMTQTTLVLAGGLAGVVNNTPVVAVLIPMVTDLADTYRISPSKLLLPLSYAAMLGGTLTLIGSSTILLASTISARLIDHPFSMFEFTHLGLLGLGVGIVYLSTIGQRLLPSRVAPSIDLIELFDLRTYVSRLYIRERSPLVGQTIVKATESLPINSDQQILEVVRDGDRYAAPGPDFVLEARDVIIVRADQETLRAAAPTLDLWQLPWMSVADRDRTVPAGIGTLVEVKVPNGSDLVGQAVGSLGARERYKATILAVQRNGEIIHEQFDDLVLERGDTLVFRTASGNVDVLRDTTNLILTAVAGSGKFEGTATGKVRANRAPVVVAIIAGVVLIAAFGLLSIAIAALGGVVAMIVTGVLEPDEAYEAISWNVIFLLAGMIPLGMALENSGGATWIAQLVAELAGLMPPVAVLLLFYVLAALLTNIILPNATVVLLIPIAIDVALAIGVNPFSFVLAVTFAASTSFLTPLGYQTNLMVFGPGGYEFSDFFRVGAPLQAILAVVTTLGIMLFWGL
ncbi:citrate transporter [Halodesulfurarchaeum formicicum]|uniref:Citrate transporter n=1 Tax=Halodesulfurarchaeum formicicum TaxID=1873524 RepID=A0A1D8S466_9EURY|nr:SLC13 family permease [Halodesulfurarchaeum formicicum]AOW80141.1 citrate transporter [Halodesulfurarchaeum formicicum]